MSRIVLNAVEATDLVALQIEVSRRTNELELVRAEIGKVLTEILKDRGVDEEKALGGWKLERSGKDMILELQAEEKAPTVEGGEA